MVAINRPCKVAKISQHLVTVEVEPANYAVIVSKYNKAISYPKDFRGNGIPINVKSVPPLGGSITYMRKDTPHQILNSACDNLQRGQTEEKKELKQLIYYDIGSVLVFFEDIALQNNVQNNTIAMVKIKKKGSNLASVQLVRTSLIFVTTESLHRFHVSSPAAALLS